MRKLLSIILVLLLLLSLGACGKKAGQDPEIIPTPTVEQMKPDSSEALFSQDWFGWWSIDKGLGIYQGREQGDNWWDACARIEMKDGVGTLRFYDELCGAKEPLATLQASVVADGPTAGCLVVGNGKFINMDTPKNYWLISPKGSLYDNLIRISGRYDDPENPGSSFEYTIVLKPWGQDWEDVPASQRPYHYDGWYLPLIQGGKDMPDTIG